MIDFFAFHSPLSERDLCSDSAVGPEESPSHLVARRERGGAGVAVPRRRLARSLAHSPSAASQMRCWGCAGAQLHASASSRARGASSSRTDSSDVLTTGFMLPSRNEGFFADGF